MSGLRSFSFIVYDDPKPWQRPRFSRKTGKFFTAKPDVDARHYLRSEFLSIPEVLKEVFAGTWEPLGGPIRLTVTAWLRMPKLMAKKRQRTALPTKRPDLDNYLKQVEDALQKYAFKDDSQIVTVEARKRYVTDLTGTRQVPCWEIQIDEIQE